MVGKSNLDFLHPDDISLHNQLWEQVINGEPIGNEVYRLRNTHGDYHWYETFHRPIADENGWVNTVISSSRDITEKVKLTREVDEVRKKVARDFHDEMGNNLASISVLSQLIQAKIGKTHNGISGLLIKIDTASRNLFNGTRDFIWAIDPKNDYLKEVFFNLKDFGEELFDNTGINFYSSFENPAEKDLKLPSGWSRQIVLIYKEALTNSLKYAKAPHVYLTFSLHASGSFEIFLRDDGVGFEMCQKESLSRGIHNMRGRAEKIGVNFSITSEKMEGTKVYLQTKITQNGVEVA
jgi:signal transduction histidine kinase